MKDKNKIAGNGIKESLKSRLKQGETVFGSFVKLNSPQVVEMLGYAGLDFIIIDMEHTTIGFHEIENMIRAAELSQMDTIVRIPSEAEEHVLHALDAGAQGVQIPGLTTAAGAEEAIACGKYTPLGRRGLSFNQRSARYGFVEKDAYIKEKNEESLFVIHIENKEMVGELTALCQNPQVDVLFIGPMDLSQSYGTPGQVDSEPVKAAIQTIVSAASAAGKSTGIFVTKEEDMKQYIDLGISYIVWSSDIGFCTAGAKAFINYANKL